MLFDRRTLRRTTFGLALLMAFPWPVALASKGGSSTSSIPSTTQVQLDEAARHLQLFGGPSDPITWESLPLAFVLGAVESDDDSPVAVDLAGFTVDGFAIMAESTAIPPLIVLEPSSQPFLQRLCLRC